MLVTFWCANYDWVPLLLILLLDPNLTALNTVGDAQIFKCAAGHPALFLAIGDALPNYTRSALLDAV